MIGGVLKRGTPTASDRTNMDRNSVSVEDINASLTVSVRREVARLTVMRFATVATGRLAYSDAADPALVDALRRVSDLSWNPDCEVDLAEVELHVMDYLDTYDEEPEGAEYYLYTALLLILMGIPAIREASVGALDRLSEYSMRFARHVDWQLKKSRILTVEAGYFQNHERSVWVAHSNLPNRLGRLASDVGATSSALGGEYAQAIDRALRPQASADYVLVYSADDESSVLSSIDCGWPGLRFETAESIYLDDLDDANLTYFVAPRYLYIWTSKVASMLPFLSDISGIRAFVDSRREDGMVVPLEGFIRNPLEATQSWSSA